MTKSLLIYKHFLIVSVNRLTVNINININQINTNYYGINEAGEDSWFNTTLMPGCFLYSKAKTKGSPCILQKTKFLKQSILTKNSKL